MLEHGISEGTFHILPFMQECAIDTINLIRLVEYCKSAKLAYKLDYTGTDSNSKINGYPLFEVLAFLGKLSEQSTNGRILILDREQGDSKDCKYVNLNPSQAMQPLIEAAHAVILAGGTMSPISDIIDSLFPTSPVAVHSFSHVISQDRFLLSILQKGPTEHILDTRHENRDDAKLWQELGAVLVNFARISPGSLCVFFASHHLLNQALHQWSPFLLKLQDLKPGGIFVEERERGAMHIEKLLSEYSKAQSAILFAVMGGRLSEGINLSDGLCRLLLLIGLPYVNERDPEVSIRIQATTKKYLHNQCMRRVNQTIGRALRHAGDFAYIALCDYRFASETAIKDLPRWMHNNVHIIHIWTILRSGCQIF